MSFPAAIAPSHPDAWSAVKRGLLCRCPQCGEGRLFRAYLKFSDSCSHCGAALGEIRADDMPAWLTILVTGHLVVPLMLIEIRYDAPDWLALWSNMAIAVAMVLALLPLSKGAIGGFLWSMKMADGVPH